ncbi:DUF6374 family protein [Nocardia sp. NPDC003482]|uniref:DUF6374 family protein n=1 Tax=Nocardia sp. NPDC004068 TaxID=3364303 RepID=UPI003674A606
MPPDRHIHLAQLWLEEVRDNLATAAATSSPLDAEQLNILSGKVAHGLYVFSELTAHRGSEVA